MAYGLVGSLPAVATGTTSATPAWGTSQNRTAGNLLICWCVDQAGTIATPAGWTKPVNLGTQAKVFFKVAAGADAVPTISGGGTFCAALLSEFSGNDTVSPEDKSGTVAGTTTPLTASGGTADTAAAELLIGVGYSNHSMAATNTTSNTFNNGATATGNLNNDATSSAQHYRFSYGITTGNAAASTCAFAYTTTNITGAVSAIASFKLAGATPSDPNFSAIGQMGFFGAHHRSFDREESGLYVPRRRVELV